MRNAYRLVGQEATINFENLGERTGTIIAREGNPHKGSQKGYNMHYSLQTSQEEIPITVRGRERISCPDNKNKQTLVQRTRHKRVFF